VGVAIDVDCAMHQWRAGRGQHDIGRHFRIPEQARGAIADACGGDQQLWRIRRAQRVKIDMFGEHAA